MNFIEETLFRIYTRVKVVHSIPGRLRLSMPFLKEVPEEWQIENRYLEIIKLIEGVEDFEFSYVTGNALIKYDKNKTNPDKLIVDIKTIANIGKEHHKVLSQYTSEKKYEALQFLKDKIEKQLNKQSR